MRTGLTVKEIASELRKAIKIDGCKFSIRVENYRKIHVSLMSANFQVTTIPVDHKTINEYNIEKTELLTQKGKVLFQVVNQEVLKYHWDESDAMTDYFNCAFYYSLSVGKWDNPFIQN